MSESQGILLAYPAPSGAVGNQDFSVRVRLEHGEWHDLFSYNVKVDMHNVRNASMVYFDFSGTVEIEVIKNAVTAEQVVIRPLSLGIEHEVEGNRIYFKLDRPAKLSLEVDGERFHNLHIFANPIETDAPNPASPRVVTIKPGIHRTEDILRLISSPITTETNELIQPDVIFFESGMHYLEEAILRIPSGTTVYISGGAVVVGSMVCECVQDVTIRGRGVLYLSGFERFAAFRGVRIVFSRDIKVEGIITIDPPHYSIYIGQSEKITIENFKSFSSKGWSDGIDMMSCSNIDIDDVFLRTSDDCIAIYGHRWDFYGDSRNIRVRNSILWADVAHPTMVGIHGDHENDGNLIENIVFENIDILEHHEPQRDYWGCMAINPGDGNTVRNVRYENIRVEPFELGELFNIRVVHNTKYNPKPGTRVENIYFKDIFFSGTCENPSRIEGFDETRVVDGVTFENVVMNGRRIDDSESGNINIGNHVHNVIFKG